DRAARLMAEGSDRRSATRVKVLLDYAVAPDAAASRVELRLRFRLAGPLAQYSRSGLVTDYVAEVTRLFGENLRRSVAAPAVAGGAAAAPLSPAAGPSLWGLLWARVKRWLGG
ncbi:MAG: hypothetical protein JNM08_04190, partial [Rubrivivax sp.]|nr:hypothetical protein [Rubrivivax sp.]